MDRRKIGLLTLAAFIFLVQVSLVTALAANNFIPVTRLADRLSAILISELAPPECAGIRNTLETIVQCGGGYCSGAGNGKDNELILGTAGNDVIDGGNGNDCIVGGGGNDTLNGDNGDDVLVGGPGSDTLDGGQRNKDTDTCIDDAGTTTFLECEVIP